MSWAGRVAVASTAPTSGAPAAAPSQADKDVPAPTVTPPAATPTRGGPKPGQSAGPVRGSAWGRGPPLKKAGGVDGTDGPVPAAATAASPSPPSSSPRSAKAGGASSKMTYLWTCMRGSVVRVRLMSKKVLEGVFVTHNSDENSILLRAVEVVDAGVVCKGGPLVDSMSVSLADIEGLEVKNLRFGSASNATPGPKTGFRTDAETTGNQTVRARQLESWTPDSSVAATHSDSMLDREAHQHELGKWDQFKANKEQFGVESSYDFELYTTKLDKQSSFFKANERKANKLADEILKGKSGNVHIDRDRGYDGDGLDDETLFSAVSREPANPNSYVVPAKRQGSSGSTDGAGVSPTANTAPPGGPVPEAEPASNRGAVAAASAGPWSALVGSKSKEPVVAPQKTSEPAKAADGSKTDEAAAKKKTLNPNAKEFKFNPAAKAFNPSGFGAAAAPAPAANAYPIQMQPGMQPMAFMPAGYGAYPMMGPQGMMPQHPMQGGYPMHGPGLVPVGYGGQMQHGPPQHMGHPQQYQQQAFHNQQQYQQQHPHQQQ